MPATMTRPVFLSPQKIADALDVSRRAVYKWIKQGKLDSSKVGNSRRVSEKQLAAFIGEDEAREVFDSHAE